MNPKIGVGIIGVQPERSWAAIAHIPALHMLPDFDIRALSTTRIESASAAAQLFNVPQAFDNHHDLVSAADVDLVVIAVKVPHHLELAMAAIDAGKHIYCEWPLGKNPEEAAAMTARAAARGVKAFIGLQARSSPVINRVRDLITEGYVGTVLSTTLVGSGMAWGAYIDQPNAYTNDRRNGATMLSIPVGHTVDALCYCLGEFTQLSGLLVNRRPHSLLMPEGTPLPMTSEDQVLVQGVLHSGATASVHYRGGSSRGTNLLWEINGTEGDIRITSSAGHAQIYDLELSGGRGDAADLQPLTIPAAYYTAPAAPALVHNIAEAYLRVAQDIRTGSHTCPTFADAVERHHLLDAIERSSRSGQRVTL